jgi:hypothetical protein
MPLEHAVCKLYNEKQNKKYFELQSFKEKQEQELYSTPASI